MSINNIELTKHVSNILAALSNSGGGSSGASTINKSFYNLSTPIKLNLPVVTNTEGGTHPSVLSFPDKLFGYEFWMAYTPYPLVEKENPCILCSTDGVIWETPAGLTNPIEPAPATGYNSDTELVLVSGGKLRCYWRWYVGTTSQTKLYYKESSDGVTWGAKVECIVPMGVDPLSPCITQRTDGNYLMWIGGTGLTPNSLRRLQSTDGITWTNLTDCTTNFDANAYSWHPMVWGTPTGWHCITALRNTTRNLKQGLNTDLYYGKSKDGITWVFDENPIFSRGEKGIKNYRVYRSCAVEVAGRYKLYISGLGAESEMIHVVDADKMGDLAAW